MSGTIRNLLAVFTLLAAYSIAQPSAAVADTYDIRQARSNISDAEYQMRRAESAYRDADYYKRQAESHQRDASYYTRQGNASKAKEYLRKADDAMDRYNSKIKDAERAERNAADYLRRASDRLRW